MTAPGPILHMDDRLRRDLMAGRLAMVAFLVVVIGRVGRDLVLGSVDGTPAVVAGTGLVVLCAAWTFFWLRLAGGRDSWTSAVAFGVILAAALALVVANHRSGIYPMYYAAVVAGAALQWRVGVPLVGLAAALTAGLWVAAGEVLTLQIPVIVILLGGSAVVVRRYVAAYTELQAARDALSHLAAVEARADLARDLHDHVGQQLSAVILQGELLSMELGEGGNELGRQRASTLVSAAREALKGVREVVARERGPRLEAEVEVAAQLLEASHVSCSVSVEAASMPTATDQVLAWAVREGTSNVMRHSQATQCSLSVRREDGRYALEITDNGLARGAPAPGNGLRGLRERLQRAGGDLSVDSATPHGVRLRATVPLEAPR
jgi:two-component system sensor histidine kinase DesK